MGIRAILDRTVSVFNRLKTSKNKFIRSFVYFLEFNPGVYLIRLLTISAKASLFYKTKFSNVLKRSYYLSHKKGFGPSEQYLLGLLEPGLKPEDDVKYCSPLKMRKIQASVNPVAWMPATEDKGIFYKYCMANGIAVPRLYAIFFKHTAGWTFNGFMPTGKNDWSDYLENNLPVEFVIKPARGFYGQEIKIFKRYDRKFIDLTGKSCTAGEIVDFMSSSLRFDSFVIQERLKNHPELVRLSESEVLQCARLITFIDANRKPGILYRQLKIVVGSSVIDNFEHGKTGNIVAQVSPSGFLYNIITMKSGRPGLVNVDYHPKTGINLKEYQVPMWEETCEFTKDVALKFYPIRAIGWDVAITPDGPFLIEGNSYFDAPNWHAALKDILDSIHI